MYGFSKKSHLFFDPFLGPKIVDFGPKNGVRKRPENVIFRVGFRSEIAISRYGSENLCKHFFETSLHDFVSTLTLDFEKKFFRISTFLTSATKFFHSDDENFCDRNIFFSKKIFFEEKNPRAENFF